MRGAVSAGLAALVLLPTIGAVDPAEERIEEAARAIRKEAFVPARRALDAAEALVAHRDDEAARAELHRWRGVFLDATGDAEAAVRAYAQSIEIARRAGDRRAEAAAFRDMGFGHWRRAEYGEADGLARRALSIQRIEGDRAGEGASLDLLGRIALKKGRTDEALDLLSQAAAVSHAAGDRFGEIESRLGLMATRLERREFDDALSDALALERIGAEMGDRDVVVEALDQAAIVWLFQGAPDAALGCLTRARRIASRPPDAALLARVRHLEANALRARGDHEASIAAHDEAIAAYAALGNRREEAWNLARRARSFAALGRNVEAESSLAAALAIWEAEGDRRPIAYWTYERGRLLERTGRYDEAWHAWEDALRQEEDIELPYQALVLSEMGWLAARRHDAATARDFTERAVASGEESGIPEMLWSALYRKALVERTQGRRQGALDSLDRCLSVIESMRRRVVPVDEALVGFLEDKQEVFAEAVDLLMELGRTEAALEIGERARARAFLDLLQDRPAPVTQPIPTLASIERAAKRHGSPIVEYFVGHAATYAWIFMPNAPVRAIRIEGGQRTWVEKLRVLRAKLEGDGVAVPNASRVLLCELERDLWEPVRPLLRVSPDDHVTIVPHGPLLTLPFAALIDPHGRYLVESYTIDYAPSIEALDALYDRAAHAGWGGGYLVVGNPTLSPGRDGSPAMPPLPAAEAEATSVAASLGGQPGDLLIGDGATEGVVRTLAPTRVFLHFATHGIVRDDDPLESALLLAPSPGTGPACDGRLTAGEILDLPLHARLVALSACDTGLGHVTGEGMLGLCRSFLHAGATSVVVGLWRVSDLVAEFQMTRFYSGLAEGEAPARALRHAQLVTIEALRSGAIRTPGGRSLTDSPLLWAPYVLIGEGGR